MWDDIGDLWHCLIGLVDDYLTTGRGETSFPDQPVPIILERIHGGALFTIHESKVRVEPVIFCRELLDEAERFWCWTQRWGIPVDPIGSPEALQEIDRIRPKIPWR